jgi:glycine dehydrogenase subunit 2
MVEPTETETKETLDEAVAIFREIYKDAMENPGQMHEKPEHAPIRRPDEVQAARKPVLRYAFEDQA